MTLTLTAASKSDTACRHLVGVLLQDGHWYWVRSASVGYPQLTDPSRILPGDLGQCLVMTEDGGSQDEVLVVPVQTVQAWRFRIAAADPSDSPPTGWHPA